jgi:peptidoglycan/LPS O-acetylase OafA/YrhL
MKRIYGFDALRAFSVGLVILSHAGIISAIRSEAWQTIFSVFNANFGVRTFFVLSGFLITTLLLREGDESGGIDIPSFLKRRALRILPLYFLIVSIAIGLVLCGVAVGHRETFYYATFFAFNFVPQKMDLNYLSHLWSLAVEEQFYFVWPIILSLLIRRKAALLLVSLATAVLCYARLRTGYDVSAEAIYYPARWTIPAILPIMVGSATAILLTSDARLAIALKSPVALIVGASCILIPLFHTYSAETDVGVVFGIALIVAWIFLNQERFMVRCLDSGPIGYIGKISFGLYMWQGFLSGNGPYRDTPHWPPPVGMGMALAFVITPISYHLFENPIRSMAFRVTRRRTQSECRRSSSLSALHCGRSDN